MDKIMEFLTSIALDGGLIIIAVCMMAGEIVKRWIPDKVCQNKFIPLINIVLGAVIAVLIPSIFAGQTLATMIIYGGLLGATASGIFEGFKALSNKSE